MMILVTPIESATGAPLFATLDQRNDKVSIFLGTGHSSSPALGSFTWKEYTDMLARSVLNTKTMRLTLRELGL